MSSPPSPPPAAPDSAGMDALRHSRQRWQTASLHIADLFAHDPQRAERYSLEAAGLWLDYSRHRIDAPILEQLLALAQPVLPAAIQALFAGAPVNNTEQRAALHIALRSPRSDSPQERAAHDTLARMENFVHAVSSGRWKGHDGRPITDVVNIGIGGSDLGPAMVYQALSPYHLSHLRCHFVSNVDPLHLEQTLLRLDAASTLFVIASKTFTTLETSLNAQAARRWLLDAGVTEATLARHCVAVSANVERAAAFGIDPANIFPMWDWVGGRYSLWSAIGLPVALGIGMANFRALLTGAHAMDQHFHSAPLACNMPVLLALLALWYLNIWQAESQVVLPYAQNLQLLPAFLQQLDMESLGKRVRRDGSPLDTLSGGILWGSAGTNGQHSFHQLLHQGTHLIPADFIAVATSPSHNRAQHQQVLANCLAQSQALMLGKTLAQASTELRAQGLAEADVERLAPHKVIPGNRPSSTLLLQRLDPHNLGALIALYEHKVYAHSVLLDINAFDQWGVELGKVLSGDIYAALTAATACDQFDPSTNALINRLRRESP